MTEGPILETHRLILRVPRAEDFPAFAQFMAEDQTRFIGGPQTAEVAWRTFSMIIGAWSVNGWSMFSFIEKSTGQWVGRGGPWSPLGWPGVEVGWGLTAAAQGKGYAVEAATAAIDFAVDRLGWTDIIHCIDPANHPSQKVAKALGSYNRGPGKLPAPLDHYDIDIWGQTAAEWKAR